MSLNFKIVEQKEVPYETLKEAYLNGLRGDRFREKFGMGTCQYTRLLRDFREDGIIIPKRGKTAINKEIRWYSHEGSANYDYYVVKRIVNGKRHIFGRFKTEAEAKHRSRSETMCNRM